MARSEKHFLNENAILRFCSRFARSQSNTHARLFHVRNRSSVNRYARRWSSGVLFNVIQIAERIVFVAENNIQISFNARWKLRETFRDRQRMIGRRQLNCGNGTMQLVHSLTFIYILYILAKPISLQMNNQNNKCHRFRIRVSYSIRQETVDRLWYVRCTQCTHSQRIHFVASHQCHVRCVCWLLCCLQSISWFTIWKSQWERDTIAIDLSGRTAVHFAYFAIQLCIRNVNFLLSQRTSRTAEQHPIRLTFRKRFMSGCMLWHLGNFDFFFFSFVVLLSHFTWDLNVLWVCVLTDDTRLVDLWHFREECKSNTDWQRLIDAFAALETNRERTE